MKKYLIQAHVKDIGNNKDLIQLTWSYETTTDRPDRALTNFYVLKSEGEYPTFDKVTVTEIS